jgi:hypothetical protein
MGMSTLERHVLFCWLEVSTPQDRGLSCPGHVRTTVACAAPGLIYNTEACAALGPAYTLGPELQLHMSALQSPVLHLDGFSLQGPELHLDVSGQQCCMCCSWTYLYKIQRPVLHSDVSTHWGLSFTWTCLHYRVLCCT